MSRTARIPPSVRETTRQAVLAAELEAPHVNGTLLPGDEVPLVGDDEMVRRVRQESGLGQSWAYEVTARAARQRWMYAGDVPGHGPIKATLTSSLMTWVNSLRHVEAAQHRKALRPKFSEWGNKGGRPPKSRSGIRHSA